MDTQNVETNALMINTMVGPTARANAQKMKLQNVFQAEYLAMISVEMDWLNVANDVFHHITRQGMATENVTVNAWDVGGNVMGPVGMDTFLVEATTASKRRPQK